MPFIKYLFWECQSESEEGSKLFESGSVRNRITKTCVYHNHIIIVFEPCLSQRAFILREQNDNNLAFIFLQEDVFIVEAVDLKRIKSIRIGHDNGGAAPGWYLEKVIIKEKSGKYGAEQTFPCNKWFATDEEDGQISRELTEDGPQNLTSLQFFFFFQSIFFKIFI